MLHKTFTLLFSNFLQPVSKFYIFFKTLIGKIMGDFNVSLKEKYTFLQNIFGYVY